MDGYITALEKDELPIEKGLIVSEQQGIVREVINQIMCNHYIHWENLAAYLNISEHKLKATVCYDEIKLKTLADDGLLRFDDKHLEATTTGAVLIRNIAALFDPMLETGEKRYSKTV